MAIQDVNILDVSANVIELLVKANNKDNQQINTLQEANKPMLTVANSTVTELRAHTTLLTDINNAMYVGNELLTVQNDLMYDLLLTKENEDGGGTGIALTADFNAQNLVEEMGVLTHNHENFALVLDTFRQIGDVLDDKFVGLGDGLGQTVDGVKSLANVTDDVDTNKAGSGIKNISLAMLALGGAIFLFDELVTVGGLLKLGLGVIGLGLAVEHIVASFEGIDDPSGIGQTVFSITKSLGLMAGVVFLFDNIVTFGGILKFALATTAFVLAIDRIVTSFGKTDEKTLDKMPSAFRNLSIGLALLPVSIMLYDLVSGTAILKMGLTFLALGALFHVLGKVNVPKISFGLLLASGAIATMALAISLFEDVKPETILKTILTLGSIGITFFLIGKSFGSILVGALAVLAISASLYVFNLSLQSISDANYDYANLGIFALILGGLGLAFTLLAPMLPLIATGAGAVGIIGGAIYLLGQSVASITEITFSEEQAEGVILATKTLGQMVTVLADEIGVVSAVKAPVIAVPLASAILPLSFALNQLSKVTMPTQKIIDGFEVAIGGIGKAFTQFGLLDMAKLVASAPVMLSMGVATVTMANSIRSFSDISANPTMVQTSVDAIDTFVGGFANTMNKYSASEFIQIEQGVSALSNVGNMMSSVAYGVQRIGNMQFDEYEVRGGKRVLVGTRSFTEDDFAKVGKSVGMILGAITEPLAKIGQQGSGATFSLFGYEVFSVQSNDVQQGIQALKGIGDVFNPIANVVDVFAKNNIDETKVEGFSKLLGQTLSGITKAFVGLEVDEGMSITEISSFALATESFFTALSGNDLDKTQVAVNQIGDGVIKIKDGLGGIELDKLSKLSEIIYNSTHFEEANLNAMMLLIEKINELIGTVGGDAKPTTTEGTTTVVKEVKEGESTEQAVVADNTEVIAVLKDMVDLLSSGTVEVRNRPIEI